MVLKKNIKMDTLQARASQPDAHIWVNANAGTGKTTILTSRVLRLLLSGVPPRKILCLTYTKAAAAEMLNRINKTLADWAIMESDALTEAIESLIGIKPSTELKERAKRLFIEVLETHEGLKVQTIHAFAQSMLKRFPIEAGVSPYFQLMDEQQSARFAEQALQIMLSNIEQGKLPELRDSLDYILSAQAETTVWEQLRKSLADVMRWNLWLRQVGGMERCIEKLKAYAEVPDASVLETEIDALLRFDSDQISIAERAIQQALTMKTHQEEVNILIQSLRLKLDERLSVAQLDDYGITFHTKDLTPRKWFSKKKEFSDDVKQLLQQQAEMGINYALTKASIEAFQKTCAYYRLADIYLQYYDNICRRQGVMDYQQLLMKTEQLLSSQHCISGWVMFKMDGGLDHLLVDEAQDTSPEQWNIIKALADEFFVGDDGKDYARSLFIVGDEKQSIFSFQGADAEEFQRMKQWFQTKAQSASIKHAEINLETSYRSQQKVLDAVNATVPVLGFDSHHKVAESSIHDGDQYNGRVVCWPVLQKPKKSKQNIDDEVDSDEIVDDDSELHHQLAENISAQIASWLAGGKCSAKDIMILVRTRTHLVSALSKACRDKNIPVISVDRTIISEHLAVQDMLSLGRWLILPENDYDLACVLRSPIGQLDEQQLFNLAYNRDQQTLWQQLKKQSETHEKLQPIVSSLEALRNQVDFMSPYQLFYQTIMQHGVLNRYKARFGDDIETIFFDFLKQADVFESEQPSSMQLFLDFMEHNQATISRVDGDANAVRIMTVHGSKGLEANIVIIADAASYPSKYEPLVWLSANGEAFPVCPPSSKFQSDSIKFLMQERSDKQYTEYQRLLYVAMTRARQELYITGYATRNSRFDQSWYATLTKTLEHIAEFKGFEIEESLIPIRVGAEKTKLDNEVIKFPDFLISEHTQQITAKTIAPSRARIDPLALASKQDIGWRKRIFGKAVHAVLQLLKPPHVMQLDEIMLDKLIHIAAKECNAIEIADIRRHVWNLVKHPDTAFLFDERLILNETSLIGTINIDGKNQEISAQVDRAVLQGNMLWVVDFKTSEHIPISIESTPKAYIRQLAMYAGLIKQIYPDYSLCSALVWTHAPKLQLIPDAILAKELLDESTSWT